jgi:hypothetical protein
MATFTATYSRLYQSEQNCQCDNDHDECPADSVLNFDETSTGILKRSRRIRRVCLIYFTQKTIYTNFLSSF